MVFARMAHDGRQGLQSRWIVLHPLLILILPVIGMIPYFLIGRSSEDF